MALKKTGGSKKRNHEPAAVKYNKKRYNGPKKKLTPGGAKTDDGKTRLNKYISQAGICSRREADKLIELGSISVNGEIINELGYKVSPGDVVKYEGQKISHERLVYLILNKPKNYLTTMDDPQSRRTVLEIIKNACKERIYPVGRLDRNTTGVLLFTNDGDLTTKLTHPKHGVQKIYQVELDKNFSQADFNKLQEGIQLQDGFIKPDDLAYSNINSKKEIGIEIHSGKNRVVRRIFESMGYVVTKLDRTYFAGLSKKNLSRGMWRFLTEEEIKALKMLG